MKGEEGGAYTYTGGIYRSGAASELGVLAAVPAGPRVPDRESGSCQLLQLFI